MQEIWRDIKGWEGYYMASTNGRILSLGRKIINTNGSVSYKKETFLTPSVNQKGYCRVTLSGNGIKKQLLIHRIIAIEFIEKIKNKNIVNHKNGIKTDNRVENLEWCTCQENSSHAVATGLLDVCSGTNQIWSKLSDNEILIIRKMYSNKNKYYQLINMNITLANLGRIFGVSGPNIRSIVKKETWNRVV